MPARGDQGYATLAAIAGIIAFALIGLEAVSANRGSIAAADGQVERARLAAAADAGLAVAISGLASDPARWPIDGRTQELQVGDVTLTVGIEDERGKVPINIAETDTERRLLSAAGMGGARLDALVDALDDWKDNDDDARATGAEASAYAGAGIAPRNGDFRTVEELMAVKGMSADLFRRIAPALTVFFGESGGFDEHTAQPLALAAQSGGGAVDVIERQRELAGQRTAIAARGDTLIPGRDVTVRVIARRGNAALERVAIVELTGGAKEPYWIRYLQ